MKPIKEITISNISYTGSVLQEALNKTADRHLKFSEEVYVKYKDTDIDRYNRKHRNSLNYANEIRRGIIRHSSTLERVKGFLTGKKVNQLSSLNIHRDEDIERNFRNSFGNTRVFNMDIHRI